MTAEPPAPDVPSPRPEASGRPTLGAAPPAAVEIFGPRLGQAQRYAELLAGPGIERGLLGPREIPRLWERHLVNSAQLATFCDASSRVVDLGSGAGLPGIPLALARPDLRVVLLEPLQRRATFLELCRVELVGLDVEVRRGRAEDGLVSADVVTARAVAPLARLVDLAAHCAAPGGLLVALKGRQVRQEVDSARDALARWRAELVDVVSLADGSAAVLVRYPTGARRRAQRR